MTDDRIIGAALPDDEEQPSVEAERDDPQLLIKKPFDPEKIKVRTENRVVEQIISRIAHNEIDLAPDFQRLRGIWNRTRKSRLIESLLLRVPLPVFYVAADADENWAVVDGLQRISTMDDFINNRFELSGLEYLRQYEEHKFEDIPRAMQRRINETQLLIHVIDPGTPEEVMFNIFSRINTGGVRLNGQEIRHALHKGPARQFLKDLAESKAFIEATDGTVRVDRMADRECVLRFLAFFTYPWQKYESNDLDGFLSSAMTRLNSMKGSERASLSAHFERAMLAARGIFGNDAFRKRYDIAASSRNPVSKALFEAWSVALAHKDDDELRVLVEEGAEVKSAFVRLMCEDREFDVSISYSTGVPQRVEKRFSSIEALIKSFLE